MNTTTNTTPCTGFFTFLPCTCGDCPNCDQQGLRGRYTRREVAKAAQRAGDFAVRVGDATDANAVAVGADAWAITFDTLIVGEDEGEMGPVEARDYFVRSFVAAVRAGA